MYQLKIVISGLPKLSMNGPHSHWRVKLSRARQWQALVMLAVGKYKPESPLSKALITYTRHSSMRPDFDNMVASFKHLQDGLKMAGVIVDDKYSVVGEPKYLWEKAPRGEGYVTIEVIGEDVVKDDEATALGRAF